MPIPGELRQESDSTTTCRRLWALRRMHLRRLTGIVLFGLGADEILDNQTYDLKPDKRAAS